MALFLRLRAVAVSNYRILCCPDFPLAIKASDYINELTLIIPAIDNFGNYYLLIFPTLDVGVYHPVHFRIRFGVLLAWNMRKAILIQLR